MYGGRYGIWGMDPYGPNAMDQALKVAGGLGAIQQQGLQNAYTPQDKAISLANALTSAQNLDWQKQRFGGDAYAIGQIYGKLPAELKLRFAAEHPELVAQAVQGSFGNNNNPRMNNSNYAMSVLQPYLGNSQEPAQMNQQQSGIGNYQPPVQSNSPEANAPNNSPISGNDNTVNAIKDTADDALQKKLRNADQQKRDDAGRRAEIAIEKANKNIPLLAAYSGILGRMKFGKDAAASAAGYTTPEYQAYKDMIGINEMLKGDLGIALGKRSTDQAANELKKIVDISSISSNPVAFMKNWYSNMDTIKKTIASNKLTTAKIIKQDDIDITKPPDAGWNGDVYSDGKGNFYSHEDLKKLAKGGK